MATYCNISLEEMTKFLGSQGFVQIHLPNTREVVLAKIFRQEHLVYSMRIYTGIEPEGYSRECGKDAIRVEMWFRDASGSPQRAGGSKRVHRVEGWKKNLQSRIDTWKEQIGPACPRCGAPLVKRKCKNGPNAGKEFWGCINWKITGCSGKPL